MKKGIFLSIITLFFASFAQARSLEKINFTQTGEVTEIELKFDQSSKDITANRFHITEDKQIILDVKDINASAKVLREFDTSEFKGAIVFVRPFLRENKKDLRLAIQLRDNVKSLLQNRGNSIVLKIENRFGVFSQKQANTKEVFKDVLAKEEVNDRINVPRSSSTEDILENLTLSGRKKYIGRKITIDVKNVRVEDILNMIANSSGFNIITTNKISGLEPLSLTLINVAWDQILDTILDLYKLVAKKNGIILTVTTLEEETGRLTEEAKAKALSKKEEPLVTRIFPISFAEIKSITEIMQDYLTDRGKISQDERTNSLIVKDIPLVIERLIKIVEVLDTQTAQIMIESKIVEVSELFSQEIGLTNGISAGYDPIGAKGDAISTVGETITAGNVGGPGFTFASAPSTGDDGRSLLGLSIAKFGRLVDLSLTLQLMENESKGRVISSPRVITQNKQEAELSTADTSSFSEQTLQDGATVTTFKEVEATLSLKVTPQVTNEGSISLDIDLSKEQFGARPSANAPPAKQTRAVKTSVLVDNGSTIVLGGLYSYSKVEAHSGIPFLKDIPILGWLFRTQYAPSTSKNELIIFITPRIINQEEAGLSNKV